MVAEHIRGKPVVDAAEAPGHHPALHAAPVASYVVEETRVVRSWTVTPRPLDVQKQAIKDEARRRILARFPEWKQQNMTARGVELQEQWRTNGAWTAQELADSEALKAAWAWIGAVRARSGEIEVMDPIPVDFDSDARWP